MDERLTEAMVVVQNQRDALSQPVEIVAQVGGDGRLSEPMRLSVSRQAEGEIVRSAAIR